MHILTPASPNWSPPVVTISGKENLGLDTLWGQIEENRRKLTASGEFEARRQGQQVKWMWETIAERMTRRLNQHPAVKSRLNELESAVAEGSTTPTMAVNEIFSLLDG